MVALLALIAIEIGTIILRRLLGGKAKRPKAAPFEAPNVEEGASIPKIFGIQQVSGTILTIIDKKIDMVGPDKSRAEYRAKIAYGLCHGPIDMLYDIVFDERALSLVIPSKKQSGGGPYPITTAPFPINLTAVDSYKFDIAALDLFGGSDEEGGVNGEVCIYRGTEDQPFDPLIQQAYGDLASRYPFLTYIRFGTAIDQDTTNAQGDEFYFSTNTPTIKPISFILGAYPRRLYDLAISLGITSYSDYKVGQSANPIEVWFECLRDDIWGADEPQSLFNIPNLIAAAEQCRYEGRGISATLADHDLDDFLDDVMLHTRAVPYENAETGLLEVKLLRPDYILADLFEVNEDNSENFHQGEGHFLETINQIEVKYKQFDGGTPGPGQLQWLAWFTYNLIDWQTGQVSTTAQSGRVATDGRNISNVVVTRTRAGTPLTLVQDQDYRVNTVDGWFMFFSSTVNNRLLNGDIVDITYVSAPTFSGFTEATATAQNLANQEITGEIRAESYDYTMFIDKANAQEMADFLRLLTSRKLAVFAWDMTRGGSHLNTGDVVVINGHRLTNYPVRLTKVTYGAPDDPHIHCEGSEDIFGEQVGVRVPSFDEGQPPVLDLPPITDMPTLYCLGNAIRIGITSPDPTYHVEIIMADDADGSNAIVITPDGGIAGDIPYFDYALPVGVTKFFRARYVYPTLADGDLSPVLSCTTSGDPPGEPQSILPTWTVAQSQDDVEGTATLLINDPEARVQLVEVSTQIGTQPATDFVMIVSPFTQTVPLAMPNLSYVRYRITYIDLTGNSVIGTAEAIFDPNVLTPPPDEPPPMVGGSAGDYLIIPIHSADTHGVAIPNLSADWSPISPHGSSRHDASGCTECRVTVHVKKPLPDGARMSVQFVEANNLDPADEDWQFLNGVEGPLVPVDEIHLNPVTSQWETLALEARQEITLRGVVMGGDDVTPFSFHRAFAELRTKVVDDTGQPPPDPCQDTTIDFNGYGDTADAEADGWTNVPDASAGGEMALDVGGGVDATNAIRMDIIPTTFNYITNQKIVYEFNGLTPGHSYKLAMQLKLSSSFNDDPSSPLLFGVTVALFGTVGGSGSAWNGLFGSSNPLQDANHFVGAFALLNKTQSGADIVSVADSGGDITLEIRFSSALAGAHELHHVWADQIVLTDATTGALVNPCSSGPTPGNPNDPGGPLPPVPPAGSRRLVIWEPSTEVGTIGTFNGSHAQPPVTTSSGMASFLASLRAANRRLILVPFGVRSVKSGGVISQSLVLQEIGRFQGLVNYDDWLDVIAGIEIMDEPNSAAHWGTSVSFAVADGVFGKKCREVFGANMPLTMRYNAELMESSGWSPKYTQIAVQHWLNRFGPEDAWMAKNRAIVNRLGISIAWGFNTLNGGAGGSGIPGTQPGGWRMTPDEIVRVGTKMAMDSASYHISVWGGNQGELAYLNTTPYQNALVRVIAAVVQP